MLNNVFDKLCRLRDNVKKNVIEQDRPHMTVYNMAYVLPMLDMEN